MNMVNVVLAAAAAVFYYSVSGRNAAKTRLNYQHAKMPTRNVLKLEGGSVG